MKFTAIILLTACLAASAHGNSQSISISVKEVSLDKVFAQIEKQSGYLFFYTKEQLKQAGKVSINVKNASLEEVLAKCFNGQPFTYEIINNTIVIKTKDVPTPKELNPNETLLTTTIDVSGRVTDKEGKPLEGASIAVKGKNIGTVTNAAGVFMLKGLSEDDVLTISYTGFTNQTIKVGKTTSFSIQMEISENPLDEIQVVAYGTKIKREQTGNVSTVNAKDIEKQPVNNVLFALADRVPGLFITQSTGMPGSSVGVLIQGPNSLNNGRLPFYVIDGVPYTSELLPNNGGILGGAVNGVPASSGQANGNPLSFINPADIESISVLKDADATAIYGSRGANGVILITTKKAKAGKTKVDVNMQNGWGRVTRKLDLLNTQQYLEMRMEAMRNGNSAITPTDYDINGLWDKTRNTDWQRELIGNNAQYTDINVTVSGGNSNTQVLAGVGYHRETTVFPGDLSDQKVSLHFNMNNVSTNQKFRFQLTGNYLEDNNQIIQRDLTQDAITLAPNAPKIHNEDGTLNWQPDASGTSSWDNPLAYLHNRYKNKTKNLVGNAVVGYKILPDLEVKSSFGYTNLQSNEVLTNPIVSFRPERRLNEWRYASYSYNTISYWVIEPQVSYKKKFGDGKLELLVGSTIQQNSSNGLRISGSRYNSDVVLEDIRSAATILIEGTFNSTYKYNALFTRAGYTLNDKYLLNLTARRDGSSRFGPKAQFHNFGAVGAGWIFSKENFIQKFLPFVSFGKLSASYGTTGNDQIQDYRFMSLYYSTSLGVPYQGAVGMQTFNLANPFLQWEETRKLHLGLEVGLFDDRFIVVSNYFRNRSDNQLIVYNLPVQTGFNGVDRNLPATVQNSGWEFSLSTANVKAKDFSWSSNFNLTVPKNKLLNFPEIEKTGYASFFSVGQPITRSQLFRFAGVNPATGVYQFFDSKGIVTSSPSFSTDRTLFINTAPSLYGGLQNDFHYKNVELSFSFQFAKRKGNTYYLGNSNGGSHNFNQPATVLQRWQKPGDISSIQRYNSPILSSPALNASLSDAEFGDAAFARLRNVSLSWSMPASWCQRAKVNNIRLYLHGQNLLTITKYAGLDPETLSSNSLPPLKVLTVGLQVGF